ELRQALQELKEQLPDRDSDKEIYKQWWKVNGQVWTRQLREITISHRNNSHNWQFSEHQRKELQQYYNANQLLVDCLNSSCNVTPAVQVEIEETLFLPIAEIEKYR
ncbi:MAG: signal transduction protein, partial [Cyanobacteriota bacterium]|nr:signal transduction protein [Cyanobacteriota bacterium]